MGSQPTWPSGWDGIWILPLVVKCYTTPKILEPRIQVWTGTARGWRGVRWGEPDRSGQEPPLRFLIPLYFPCTVVHIHHQPLHLLIRYYVHTHMCIVRYYTGLCVCACSKILQLWSSNPQPSSLYCASYSHPLHRQFYCWLPTPPPTHHGRQSLTHISYNIMTYRASLKELVFSGRYTPCSGPLWALLGHLGLFRLIPLTQSCAEIFPMERNGCDLDLSEATSSLLDC